MENNKLIAEFTFHTQKTEGLEDCYIHKGTAYHIEEMKFDSDWNWLMECVEKIENIQDGKEGDAFRCHLYDITIRQHVVTVQNTDIEVTEYESKLLNTYYAVVEFIKWYNENK